VRRNTAAWGGGLLLHACRPTSAALQYCSAAKKYTDYRERTMHQVGAKPQLDQAAAPSKLVVNIVP